MTIPAIARRFVQTPLVFRKGARAVIYVPRDRVHEKAIRGVMARHGWREVTASPAGERRRGGAPAGDGGQG